MATAETAVGFTFGAGVLIGIGLSGTSFAVVFGAIGRAVAPEKRSMALGLASAAGSFGQFAFLPISNGLLGGVGWLSALLILAVVAAMMAPIAGMIASRGGVNTAAAEPDLSLKAALAEALSHRGFWLLSMGYFVCGFQVVFIGVHLPTYLGDAGMPTSVAATALALVGLFNIIGTYTAGRLGTVRRKPEVLTWIYLGRAVVISVFLLVPLSVPSVYLFAAAMGILWLSTVPLTTGTVAVFFGVRNLSMLGGIVFAWHQIGSFLGVWVGGVVYDMSGAYDLVWIASILLGIMAGLLNWPIKEKPVPRMEGIKAA